VLLGGPPAASAPPSAASPPATPQQPPGYEPRQAERSQTLTVLAGVGVLMLAMGVGVLIGRSTQPKQVTSPPQVITVAGGSGTTGAADSGGTSEARFTGDWPAATKKGFTVQLQTLPISGTSVSAVEAAKSSATRKGAGSVGALSAEEFSSVPTGDYVVYSGVYRTRAEAQKALAGLRKSFPAAKVLEVSNGSTTSSSSSTAEAPASGSGKGANLSKPAPSSVLNGLKSAKGRSYAEKSKNLPDVVED
jgi:hypothetical protein